LLRNAKVAVRWTRRWTLDRWTPWLWPAENGHGTERDRAKRHCWESSGAIRGGPAYTGPKNAHEHEGKVSILPLKKERFGRTNAKRAGAPKDPARVLP
jgi:hypothetical protein